MSSKKKIDINKATIEELAKVPWIGLSRARAIAEYRKKHGPFSDIDKLMCVEGISQYDFNFIKLFVDCSPSNHYNRSINDMGDKKIKESDDDELNEIKKEQLIIDEGDSKQNNTMALVGLILGIVSYVIGVLVIIYPAIGIIFILGIIFSGIGLGTFDPQKHKNKWMAWWGLALSIIRTYLAINSIYELMYNL